MSDPNPRTYRNALKGGKRQFHQRQWRRAAEYFERAVAHRPASAVAWEWLVKARLEVSTEAALVACARWAVSPAAHPSASAWAGRAWERRVLARLEEGPEAALAVCRQWAATGLDPVSALKWTGILLERLGQLDAAEDAYATAELLRRA